jgi:hypothetical protein
MNSGVPVADHHGQCHTAGCLEIKINVFNGYLGIITTYIYK